MMLILITRLLFIIIIFSLSLTAVERTPLQVAQEAFEAARDDEHRKRMRLVWSPVDEAMPNSLDVLVLRGYLNHDLLLMQWKDGMVSAHVVTVDRQWFYHAKDNARSYASVPMTATEFSYLWKSINDLILVEAVEIDPPQPLDGEFYSSRQGGTSSHAPYHLLTWHMNQENDWASLPVLRGGGYFRDNIRDLNELRMEAISKLIWNRFPKTAWVADTEGKSTAHWHHFLQTILSSTRGDNATEITKRSRLLIDAACEMLGDFGNDTDVTLLQGIATTLRSPAPPEANQTISSTYWEDGLRTAIMNATQRIVLRQRWNSEFVITDIHSRALRTIKETDQDRWLRKQFHQQDPDGYRAMLLADLTNTNTHLVITSINELLHHYPARQQNELHALLAHPEPDIVVTSALALLGKPIANYGWYVRPEIMTICAQAEHDPQIKDALTALNKIAGDTVTPIRADIHSFDRNPRTSALEFLGACPLPWGWDKDRCRLQLNNPKEIDGRIISELVSRISLPILRHNAESLNKIPPADRTFLITTWSKCLVTPYNLGTIQAIEELILLNDQESLPRIRQVIAELRVGCAKNAYNAIKGPVTFPWSDDYQLDKLDKKLAEQNPLPGVP